MRISLKTSGVLTYPWVPIDYCEAIVRDLQGGVKAQVW